jgi:hypothetical protein
MAVPLPHSTPSPTKHSAASFRRQLPSHSSLVTSPHAAVPDEQTCVQNEALALCLMDLAVAKPVAVCGECERVGCGQCRCVKDECKLKVRDSISINICFNFVAIIITIIIIIFITITIIVIIINLKEWY